MTLEQIMARCRVDESGCWIWAGATSEGVPRVWAPDFTLHGGEMRSQTGKRAAWHVKHRKAIPNGWRVFGTCDEALCINPAHTVCEPVAKHGEKVAASGALKGNVRKIMASRAAGRRRSRVTPEILTEIVTSPETGLALEARLGIPRQTISKARNGKLLAFEPVGGLFTALLASNDSRRRAA